MQHHISKRRRAPTPVAAVWALLVAITLVSALESARPASAAVLCLVAGLTAMKVALVIFQFMEVGRAPLWLRAACAAWIIIVMGAVTALVVFPRCCLSLLG